MKMKLFYQTNVEFYTFFPENIWKLLSTTKNENKFRKFDVNSALLMGLLLE